MTESSSGPFQQTVVVVLMGWVYVGMVNPIDLSGVAPSMLQPGTCASWASIRMPAGYSEPTIGLSVALPRLMQCCDDALRRIGAVEESGFQLTCYGVHLRPSGGSSVGHLVSGASCVSGGDILGRVGG